MRRNGADTSRIDQPWPASGLEEVDVCPLCQSRRRSIAHSNVQDWSFFGAAGKWTYWQCDDCSSLYLSPRPTPATLGHAYDQYYTHAPGGAGSLAGRLKERIANELWSHSFGASLRPRLHVPAWLRWLVLPLRRLMGVPFQLAELVQHPPGMLLDVGCGNGDMLIVARQLGWRAIGIELDPAAVRAARSRGLEVLEGSYERLTELGAEFDCVVCAHVLEHVHDPKNMLQKMADVLKPGGILLLSLPNATSQMRRHFGDDWRGLEAPRHLTIPSMRQLKATLCSMGFAVSERSLAPFSTAAESARIRRRGTRVSAQDRAEAKRVSANLLPLSDELYDYTQFVCKKVSASARELGREAV